MEGNARLRTDLVDGIYVNVTDRGKVEFRWTPKENHRYRMRYRFGDGPHFMDTTPPQANLLISDYSNTGYAETGNLIPGEKYTIMFDEENGEANLWKGVVLVPEAENLGRSIGLNYDKVTKIHGKTEKEMSIWDLSADTIDRWLNERNEDEHLLWFPQVFMLSDTDLTDELGLIAIYAPNDFVFSYSFDHVNCKNTSFRVNLGSYFSIMRNVTNEIATGRYRIVLYINGKYAVESDIIIQKEAHL